VSAKSSEERPVDKSGAERIHRKSSQELEPVYQNEGQKLVACYGCFQGSCTTCSNSDVITSHESDKFLSDDAAGALRYRFWLLPSELGTVSTSRQATDLASSINQNLLSQNSLCD
jgi:hypothetical protein